MLGSLVGPGGLGSLDGYGLSRRSGSPGGLEVPEGLLDPGCLEDLVGPEGQEVP